jgi:hypothetical protein
VLRRPLGGDTRACRSLFVIVYAIRDLTSRHDHPFGEAVDVFVRREDADRFIEEVRGDEPELAENVRIEERELRAGNLN